MPKKKKTIYLDHAATTPVDPEVKKAMGPYFSKIYGNPASMHSFGQEALKAIDEAREKIADFLGAEKSQEIIFLSGATEADNLAIQGTARAMKEKGGRHIITTAIEHPAVLEPCQALEKEGFRVSYLKVNKEGLIEVEEVKKALQEDTFLVSIMYVNNEIGAIQPIREIGKLLKKVNRERAKEDKHKIIFHTDAVQAINYLDCNVLRLHVDLLSFSGHKIYGPKGIGALYVKEGTPIKSIVYGGEHEYGLRSGTLNVPGIIGLAKASELVAKRQQSNENEKIQKLRDKLIDKILKNIPQAALLGSRLERSPANVNIIFKKVEGESIMLSLDFEGVACSTGSACASGSLEPSHIILALGLKPEDAHGSIRFTLGKDTTEEEIDYVLKVLPPIIERLRKMSPMK